MLIPEESHEKESQDSGVQGVWSQAEWPASPAVDEKAVVGGILETRQPRSKRLRKCQQET